VPAILIVIFAILGVGICYYIWLLVQFQRTMDAYTRSREQMRAKLLEIAADIHKSFEERREVKASAPSSDIKYEPKSIGKFRGREIYDHVMTESGARYEYEGIAAYDSMGNPIYDSPYFSYLIIEPGLLYKKPLEDHNDNDKLN
jgi:hypothetical protein